jgi:hypothetical protein
LRLFEVNLSKEVTVGGIAVPVSVKRFQLLSTLAAEPERGSNDVVGAGGGLSAFTFIAAAGGTVCRQTATTCDC